MERGFWNSKKEKQRLRKLRKKPERGEEDRESGENWGSHGKTGKERKAERGLRVEEPRVFQRAKGRKGESWSGTIPQRAKELLELLIFTAVAVFAEKVPSL